MSNLKETLDKKLKLAATEQAEQKPQVVARESDPELASALALVAKGELAKAYRTRNGALVVTNK